MFCLDVVQFLWKIPMCGAHLEGSQHWCAIEWSFCIRFPVWCMHKSVLPLCGVDFRGGLRIWFWFHHLQLRFCLVSLWRICVCVSKVEDAPQRPWVTPFKHILRTHSRLDILWCVGSWKFLASVPSWFHKSLLLIFPICSCTMGMCHAIDLERSLNYSNWFFSTQSIQLHS